MSTNYYQQQLEELDTEHKRYTDAHDAAHDASEDSLIRSTLIQLQLARHTEYLRKREILKTQLEDSTDGPDDRSTSGT